MIFGAHAIIYSKDAEADRAFLRDVLRLPSVDVGGGWLIFGLPPAELAVHPGGRNDVHEFYFMCADVNAFVAALAEKGVRCSPVENLGWGLRTQMVLPGGGKVGVYQPRHARPESMRVSGAGTRRKARPGKTGHAKSGRGAPSGKATPAASAARPRAKPRRAR